MSLGICVLAGVAHAGVDNVRIIDGDCQNTSHIAEGPLGADLTKRQSRFFCDSVVITQFDDFRGHVMLNFVQKEAHHTPIIGFAGRLNEVGDILEVESIYFKSGEATTVSDGACKFFLKKGPNPEIFCGATIDETGRRTVAIISFKPASTR